MPRSPGPTVPSSSSTPPATSTLSIRAQAWSASSVPRPPVVLRASPDGTQLVVRDTNHCPANAIGIVSATANNAAPTCLPNSTAGDTDPSFSPDGTKVVVATAGSNPSILNANGIGRTDFTIGPSFSDNDWAVQATTTTTTAPGPTTTTTPPPPCSGTLTGTAFKGP